MTSLVSVVGLVGGEWFGRAASAAVARADLLIGHRRHLSALPVSLPGERVELVLHEAVEAASAAAAAGRSVCLLASGDPGFFGLARLACARLGAVDIHPAPSSPSLAFARIGVAWDDAAVLSAHGRPLEACVDAALRTAKVAVLVSPDQPPEALGRALVAGGCGPRRVAVCSRLGEAGEAVVRTDLPGLAAGTFDPVSVVVLEAEVPDGGMGLAWGRPDDRYPHRGGMITKAEVRAVALGKLALPASGVLWDVGAGSGSVAIESARLSPGLWVHAVERRAGDCEQLRANVAGTGIRVVEGVAPGALAGLPDPDRAFVGGGGLPALDATLARLRPDGVVVATYASLDRAAAAASRLGNLVQVAVSRGVPVGRDGAVRLAAENPVFVCWGPGAD